MGGAGGVEDRVVEVGVGVGLGAGAEEAFALAAAHVGHVFGQVGNALLGFQFIGCGIDGFGIGYVGVGNVTASASSLS